MRKRRLKMTMEFDYEPEQNDFAHMIKYLMIDALAEFWRSRDPAGEYMARRYPEMADTMGMGWMVAKKRQVGRRIAAAKAILHGVHDNIKIEEVES